jgi:hypothetical protein
MKKFHVTIDFEWQESYQDLVEAHRKIINELIEHGVIDHYVVTFETNKIWITINAEDKASVDEYLSQSPLFNYWIYEIDELFISDGVHYRLPAVQLN